MTTSVLDDLFGAQGGGDYLEQPGTFEFEVTKAESKPSGSGKPGLKLIMKVVGGPFAGKLLSHALWFSSESEVAKNILWRSLQALGVSQDQMRMWAAGLPDGAVMNNIFLEAAKVVVGRHVVATVAKDTGNPREEYRERIKVQYDLKALPNAAATNAAVAAAQAVITPPVAAPQVAAVPTMPEQVQAQAPVFTDDAPPF